MQRKKHCKGINLYVFHAFSIVSSNLYVHMFNDLANQLATYFQMSSTVTSVLTRFPGPVR